MNTASQPTRTAVIGGSTETPLAYSMIEAAAAVSMSTSTIVRALRSTDPAAFPPPLRAKKAGPMLVILATELRRWLESLPDA